METLNDRTPRNGTSGLRTLRSAAALLALAAGTCSALAQPGTSPAGGFRSAPSGTFPTPAASVPAGEPEGVDISGEVSVDENLTVELHVRNEELSTVLQLLSLQSQRSIIAGPNVSATVTANLYGVTFYDALDAVLHTYGYGYIEQGNMIYVMTKQEIDDMIAAGRLPVAKIIHLNYLSSVDAAEYVSPLLSDVGEIRTNGRSEDFTVSEDNPEGADSYAGSAMMIVFDFEENVAEIEALVQQIDTRPEQVLVEATILQSQLREDNAFGVDFSVIGDLDFSEFIGGPLNGINNMINGARNTEGPIPSDGEGHGVSSTVGQTNGPGGLKIGIVDNDVAVFMRFLDEVTDTTVISNPKIVALNRQEGRVQVGRRIGYLQTTTTDTSTQQSVEFLDTGTQLSFRPWITEDRQIRMELRPEVSRPFLRTITDTNGNPVTIPDEDTSEIVTNVVVRDGQTIVLGGLFTESTVSGRRQWPWLGDVPILGIPFRGHNDTVERAEVIFMIKTTIMNDESLIETGRRSMAYVDRVRMGAREGLLPFSRDRRSGHLVVEAERAAAEGNMDRALYLVRRSLAISPSQPDALRLRERLLSEPTVWPSRSMLEDIISHDVDNRIRSARQEAMAEFTSLIRPDNRWSNLNSIPQQTITNVDTDSFDGTDGGFEASGPGFESDPGADFGIDPSSDPAFEGSSFDTSDFESSDDTGSFDGTDFQDEHLNQDAPTGESFDGQSFRNDGTRVNNYSWSRALDGGTTGTTSSPTGTQGAKPAATATSSNTSNQTTSPTARTSSANQSSGQGNAATGQGTQTSSQNQMFPFTRAAGAGNLPNVQPDANGFYPIVSANQALESPASAAPGANIYSRLAWIFGAKGRQQASPTTNAQETPGSFANVQETEGSQNP